MHSSYQRILVAFKPSCLLCLLYSAVILFSQHSTVASKESLDDLVKYFSDNHTNSLIQAVLDTADNGTNLTFVEDDQLNMFEQNDTEVNIGIDTSLIDLTAGIESLKNASDLDDVSGKEEASGYVEGSYLFLLLNQTRYDNRTHPTNDAVFKSEGLKTTVYFGLEITSLDNFDTSAMEYTMDINLRMIWRDIRLRHNFTGPLLLKQYKDFIERIWRPDPFFVNSKKSKFHKVTFPNFRMIINNDGTVIYNIRIFLKPSCQMVFCKYPHDKHECDLSISSMSYPAEEVELLWFSKDAVKDPHIAMPELQLKRIIVENCSLPHRLVDASCLRMAMLLERNPGRFWLEKYFPSTIAMMFSWVAPYVPYHYDEIRIITPITVLLTLVQMQRGDESIPRVSYITALDTWFAVLKVFTIASLAESLIALSFVKGAADLEKQSKNAEFESDKDVLLNEAKMKYHFFTFTDSVAKVLTPTLFTIWTLYYIFFITRGSQDSCIQARSAKLEL